MKRRKVKHETNKTSETEIILSKLTDNHVYNKNRTEQIERQINYLKYCSMSEDV